MDLLFLPTRVINVTTTERSMEKPMSTIGSENVSKPATEAQPKLRRNPTKKAKVAKKSPEARKAAGKPKSDGTNKKAEVIAMMKRVKGVTLAEIIAATNWPFQRAFPLVTK
jgi:hypothetical protein